VIPDPARLTDYLQHVLQAIDRILYYRVDLNIVWRTIATDLPDFRALVRAAANDLPASRTADRDPGPC
jgi:uncharacterized protein with HEPN domain